MKVLNICAAVLATLIGVAALFGGFSAKDTAGIQIGIGLLVTALLFGTLSAGLALLEQIRDGVATRGQGPHYRSQDDDRNLANECYC
jgi:hypothetical protein